jgi:hypothetical protein
MARHPEAHIRRAVRVLSMVGELHRRGHQRLRVMPYMAPGGLHWRCTIGLVSFFYRNHGPILNECALSGLNGNDNEQATAVISSYSSAQENQYFDWRDATGDNARTLAEKFLERFPKLSELARGGLPLRRLVFAAAVVC